uniref:Uncharacterized protein n=1 Tax=Tanacetum cinerariifolium TaxID=118510 RepID=A0A699IRA4_TANCI|nr:hypothetical protein [Tanacetum cinerariifolium]
MHQGEQLDSDVDSDVNDDDNTIPYHQYQSNNEVKRYPTDVSSVIPDGISVISILDDLSSVSSGAVVPEKPKVLAHGLYAMTPKSLCYPTNDYDALGKLKAKADIEKQLSELFQPLFDEDKEFPPDVQPQLVNVAAPRVPEIAPDSPLRKRSQKMLLQ